MKSLPSLFYQSLDFPPGPVISTILYEANKHCQQLFSGLFIEFGTLVWTFEIIHANSLILQEKWSDLPRVHMVN